VSICFALLEGCSLTYLLRMLMNDVDIKAAAAAADWLEMIG